jgi:hypothetical protein
VKKESWACTVPELKVTVHRADEEVAFGSSPCDSQSLVLSRFVMLLLLPFLFICSFSPAHTFFLS